MNDLTTKTTTPTTTGPPPLGHTAALTTFGHLTWLGWMWIIVAFCFTVALVAIGIWGSLDKSLWESAVVGWQPWPFLAAGATTVPIYAPMFVANGATRARLATSSIISMVILAVLGGAYVALGYLGESVAFDVNNWSHVLERGGDAGSFAKAAYLGFASALASAAFFTAGWLFGTAWYRRDGGPLVPLLFTGVATLVATEALLPRDAQTIRSSFLDSSRPGLAVSAVVIVAVVAGACAVAGWGTRGAAIRTVA